MEDGLVHGEEWQRQQEWYTSGYLVTSWDAIDLHQQEEGGRLLQLQPREAR